MDRIFVIATELRRRPMQSYYRRIVALRPANGLSLSCTARAHVPKPTRRGGCRRGVAKARLAICNRRDAAHTSVLTSRLGGRASAGPCQLLARVRPRLLALRLLDVTLLGTRV